MPVDATREALIQRKMTAYSAWMGTLPDGGLTDARKEAYYAAMYALRDYDLTHPQDTRDTPTREDA